MGFPNWGSSRTTPNLLAPAAIARHHSSGRGGCLGRGSGMASCQGIFFGISPHPPKTVPICSNTRQGVVRGYFLGGMGLEAVKTAIPHATHFEKLSQGWTNHATPPINDPLGPRLFDWGCHLREVLTIARQSPDQSTTVYKARVGITLLADN